MTRTAFDLPTRLHAKADPRLIARDQLQLARIDAALTTRRAALTSRLDELRRSPAGLGQGALERDLQIHRLSARLRVLSSFGLELCLGRMLPDGGQGPVYIGRLGLTDSDGEQLLIDWRTPAAEPFFAATQAHPMGLASRRRYRWTAGRVVDYWDEAFTAEAREQGAGLDDQSAFLASLGASRSPRMRNVLGTIAADQDAIVRAGSRGTLVVDGGPGTGKTVVALHRAAFLMYADARVGEGDGVLFVGPHPEYLSFAQDVLPNLGENRVQLCTVRDLVPEGASAEDEPDTRVAALKARLDVVDVARRAARFYEAPPTEELAIETSWGEVTVTAEDWAEAFSSWEPELPHDDARDQVWDALLELLVERVGEPEALAELRRDDDLNAAFQRAWPLLDPLEIVADLFAVPAFLRLCAPGLDAETRAALRRPEGSAWTTADLPLLDAARRRIGDPTAPARRRRRRAELAAEREGRAAVAQHLIEGDDSELQVMSMLRGDDLAGALLGEEPDPERDPLAGPFAHVIVDEAQELTDAQWQMLIARCPARSFTVAGDRAQARHGFDGSWVDRLARLGLTGARVATLGVNYRTPAEVMALAGPVILEAVPDANVPASVRSSGHPVEEIRAGADVAAKLEEVVEQWLRHNGDGLACVIGAPWFGGGERVWSLNAEQAKGLEFDLVVLVDPDGLGMGVTGAVDRYVAMTRATQRLILIR